MRRCRLFRKNRIGRQGRRVAVSGQENLECTEVCLGMDEVRQAEAEVELHLDRDFKDVS